VGGLGIRVTRDHIQRHLIGAWEADIMHAITNIVGQVEWVEWSWSRKGRSFPRGGDASSFEHGKLAHCLLGGLKSFIVTWDKSQERGK
jgi:hypothetical protein